MNERIREFAEQTGYIWHASGDPQVYEFTPEKLDEFAELIVRECIDKIETYRIPVGNSASGELACEWTYNALKEIRDDIKEHFGIE